MNQVKNQHDFDDYVQTQTQTEKLLFDMYLKLEVRSPKPTFIHKFNSQPDPFINFTKNKNINFISDIENNILAFDVENSGKDKDAGLLGFGDVNVEPQVLAMEVRVSVLANVEGVKNLKRIFSLQRISSHGVGVGNFLVNIDWFNQFDCENGLQNYVS